MKQLELFDYILPTSQPYVVTADDIKYYIMKSFIEDKGFEVAATEVKYCDVLVTTLKGNPIVEIETKINWYDFLADFDKPKHQKYLSLQGLVPDFFFFGVPEFLADRCYRYLEDSEYNYYGLLSVSQSGYVHTVKKSKHFPTNLLNREEFLRYLLKRGTRELISLYESKLSEGSLEFKSKNEEFGITRI